MSLFSRFCSSTSLHGFPHLLTTSVSGKSLWVFVIFAMLSVAGLLCSNTLEQYLGATVSTSLKSSTTPLTQAAFPKIVLCNKYKLRKSYMDTYMEILGDTSYMSVPQVEAIEFALYKQFVAGWGYFPSPQDKAISTTLASLASMTFSEDQYETEGVNNTEPVQQTANFTQEEFSEYMIVFCESYANISTCLESLMQGQNLESFMVQIKVHNMTFSGSGLFDSENSGLSMEISTATSYCAKISPDPARYPIRSGVSNGVEILVDLETFDNGNLDLLGDGLEVLVTGSLDYSLDQLLGFSVAPGTAVKIVVKPELFSSSQEALDNFDYVQRKCVDIGTDLESFDGVEGNYSLSNCLVSATVTEIRNK